MAALWRLDLGGAESGFARTLAPTRRTRWRPASSRAAASWPPARSRSAPTTAGEGILLGVAVLAIVAAAACAFALARPALRRARGGAGGR